MQHTHTCATHTHTHTLYLQLDSPNKAYLGDWRTLGYGCPYYQESLVRWRWPPSVGVRGHGRLLAVWPGLSVPVAVAGLEPCDVVPRLVGWGGREGRGHTLIIILQKEILILPTQCTSTSPYTYMYMYLPLTPHPNSPPSPHVPLLTPSQAPTCVPLTPHPTCIVHVHVPPLPPPSHTHNTHTHTHACTHTCTHARTHAHTHARTRTHTHTHTFLPTRHTCTCTFPKDQH